MIYAVISNSNSIYSLDFCGFFKYNFYPSVCGYYLAKKEDVSFFTNFEDAKRDLLLKEHIAIGMAKLGRSSSTYNAIISIETNNDKIVAVKKCFELDENHQDYKLREQSPKFKGDEEKGVLNFLQSIYNPSITNEPSEPSRVDRYKLN
jgi:hypothetical protein